MQDSTDARIDFYKTQLHGKTVENQIWQPPREELEELMIEAVRIAPGGEDQREGLLKHSKWVAEALRFLTSGYNQYWKTFAMPSLMKVNRWQVVRGYVLFQLM